MAFDNESDHLVPTWGQSRGRQQHVRNGRVAVDVLGIAQLLRATRTSRDTDSATVDAASPEHFAGELPVVDMNVVSPGRGSPAAPSTSCRACGRTRSAIGALTGPPADTAPLPAKIHTTVNDHDTSENHWSGIRGLC
jgi:hypothetical protein